MVRNATRQRKHDFFIDVMHTVDEAKKRTKRQQRSRVSLLLGGILNVIRIKRI